ncbi:DEAD/DEAH box helicase [Flammeovirgaceae bacterium KN852]|uniref:DEAD/DEAH box helicase n=2 Tax=Marinigracilibium pacificum TaxID=2729599 RepID=A0A848J657_9BACT|nr:DEAD/DEAH box helicase [Marinigracilibium pacificum]
MSMGFENATPIQEQAIPIVLQGRDLIGCAQTGTGKTAAYLLPVLNNITNRGSNKINTLILAPTRELVQQIDQQLQGFGYFTNTSSIPIYGGGDGATWTRQKHAMKQGVDIIVATPGRLLSQLNTIDFDFSDLQHLVLDEADRMLDMGFYDDIVRIISFIPKKRQTLLFSATMPKKIRELANKILHNPAEVNISISKPAEGVEQVVYSVYNKQKTPLLMQLLDHGDFESIIIFASRKEIVKDLEKELIRKKYNVKAFHSDLEQPERESLMRDFKNKQVRVLIGTDILARGIDVDGIDLVVNYDSPSDPEDYVHRVGRTARASRTGKAVTFINEDDQRKLFKIERMIGMEVPRGILPESLGESPVIEKRPPAGNKRKNFRKFDKNKGGGPSNKGGNNKFYKGKKQGGKPNNNRGNRNNPQKKAEG